MASTVPKFTSFRPKPKAPTISEEPSGPSPAVRETSQSRDVKKKAPSRSERPRSSNVPRTDHSPVPSKSYFSDRRGDAEVLRYGTLNRSDVPTYRRFGYGFVLGLNHDQKIDRDQSSQTKVYITPATRRRQERLLTAKNGPKDSSRALRIITSGARKSGTENEDFIQFSGTRRKRPGDGDEDEDDALEQDYRAIERDQDRPLEPDTEYDAEVEGVTIGSELTIKNSELIRKTHTSPGDLQAWLDLIEHQEAMMSLGHASSELNDAGRLQLADVRIPIYEEALKKVHNDGDNHIILYRGLFREAKRSWNLAKLSSKWKGVLQKFPESTALWLMYLNFVQSSFAGYRYESCRAAYIQCLAALQKHADAETILHVVIRMTSMIHGAGYQELALAIWQVLLERGLSGPEPPADLKELEGFWDNEAPRLGEAGSEGWQLPASADYLPATTALKARNMSDSTFADFEAREVDSIEKLRYSGRTSDDVGDDDAFHTIFFADIEEYLKLVPSDVSRTLLVQAFLCFSGLPPLARVAGHQQMWWGDAFLSSPLAQRPSQSRDQLEPFVQKIESHLACVTHSTQMTTELLFKHAFDLGAARLSADFVRRILKLITRNILDDEAFGEYLLAFESRHFPMDVVKTAKQLLKTRPTSQRLYHAYGLVETKRRNFEKADQVFSMALSMGAKDTYEHLLLLHSWAWEALDKPGGRVEALWRLTSPLGKIPLRKDSTLLPDPATLNTAQESLGKACQAALLSRDYPCAVIGTSLLALLAYLPSDFDADLALSAHQHLADYFRSHDLLASPHAELNAQAIARFLVCHSTHAPIVKPVLIRTTLEPLLASFPNNTILLSLYAANEARFAVDDRVRGIMHQNALQNPQARSVAGWSFAVHYETIRGEVAGSTSHSIRALYKRATHFDASGTHSPRLWTAYIRFELAQLRLERDKTRGRTPGKDGRKRSWEVRLEEAETRVKETFYQGLRSLPWCKDFFMLTFTEARDVFTGEELWKVYRIMQEKELRLYVELD